MDRIYFEKQLEVGKEWENKLGSDALAREFWVRTATRKVRIFEEDLEFFRRNDHDIKVSPPWIAPLRTYLLAVKSRRFYFTSVDDFPFPSAMCGTVKAWQKLLKKPHAAINVSQETGAALAAIPDGSWFPLRKPDHQRGYKQEVSWACPKDHLIPYEQLLDMIGSGQLPVKLTYDPWPPGWDRPT